MKANKIITILIVLLVLVSGGSFVAYFLTEEKEPTATEVVNKSNILDTIKDFNYTLEDRDTELFKTNFEALKEVLAASEIDYDAYAELLSKLYIIDLYTINNKINQYDVGGSEFIFPDVKENYELKVKDTIYKYIEDDSYKTRKQELPIVKNVTTSNLIKEEQTIRNTQYEGYSIKVDWDYEKDLGYDKSSTVKLIKVDNKLCIVKQNTSAS